MHIVPFALSLGAFCRYVILFTAKEQIIILYNGSFPDNFNFSMKKVSRAYNFCFISKRHVVFN